MDFREFGGVRVKIAFDEIATASRVGAFWSHVGQFHGLRGQIKPLSGDDSKAAAVLATDSLRLRFPLTAPADVGARAVAWVISPGGVRSGEVSVELAEHACVANFTQPWPRDEKNQPAAEIGWHRVGYRLEAAHAKPVNGVLSVGAIAGNLLTLRLA